MNYELDGKRSTYASHCLAHFQGVRAVRTAVRAHGAAGEGCCSTHCQRQNDRSPAIVSGPRHCKGARYNMAVASRVGHLLHQNLLQHAQAVSLRRILCTKKIVATPSHPCGSL